jgi:hypothetical protein
MNSFDSIEGWIDLGNFTDAAEELNALPPHLKSTVEFIQLWVLVYSGTKAWTNVEVMCETLLAKDPKNEFAAHHRAEALHRQGKTPDAIIFLGETHYGRKTGKGLYYLARLLCNNAQFESARSILGMAIRQDRSLRMQALDDPEFRRIWSDIRTPSKLI